MEDAYSKICSIIKNDIVDNLLKDVSTRYNIDLCELRARYLPETTKRKGRKKKESDEFIETTEYIYNGKTYLIDKMNNVYTNDMDAPMMIGERLIDGTIRMTCKS